MRRTIAALFFILIANASNGQQTRTDALGDPLPPGALLRLGSQRWRADATITLAAFRPDGKTVLTVGIDQVVQIWDLATGKEVRRFEAAGLVTDVPFSGRSGPTGRGFQGGRGLPFGAGITLSGDGKVLACQSRDGIIRTWAVETGKELRRFAGTRVSASRLALSHDGKRLAAATVDQGIALWEGASDTAVILRTTPSVAEQRFSVYRMEFGPDGKTLLQVAIDLNSGTSKASAAWTSLKWQANSDTWERTPLNASSLPEG